MPKSTPRKTPLSLILTVFWFFREGVAGLFCTILLPFLFVVVTTGAICYFSKLCTWFTGYTPQVDLMVTAHFNMVAFLLAFVGGTMFLFKDKQWNDDKCVKLKALIGEMTYETTYDRKATPEIDGAFSSFVSEMREDVDELDKCYQRIYTLFILCVMMIAFSCLTSVVCAYQARLTQSTLCYKYAYMFAVTAATLSALHFVIVLLPWTTAQWIRLTLSDKSIKKYFDKVLNRLEELKQGGDKADDKFKFLG